MTPFPKSFGQARLALMSDKKETKSENCPPEPVDAITGDLDQRQALLEGRFAAQEMFQFLSVRMAAFEKNLPEDHEMGVKLANYGVAAEIHVRGMGFQNPSIIEFYGMLSDGSEVILVQHIAQLNFVLLALRPVPEQDPFRVGFEMGESE